MKRKAIKKIIGASFISGIFVAMVTVMLLSNNAGVVFGPEYETEEIKYKPIKLTLLADNDPGAGASGVINAYVAVKDTTYTANNLTSGEYYATGDTNDTSLGTDVPYDTDHDLVIAVRWNTTHAYNATAGDWDLTLVRAYVNCTDLSLSGEAASEAEIGHDASYIWVHYYVEDQTIDRGETVQDVLWNFEYYG
ncbi:MAG: hypothetical protein GF375_00515 [Candidatus Omnitrophica bacterium]|nr:hypothetical protein [Candidatus Omnitrophota bacterium]